MERSRLPCLLQVGWPHPISWRTWVELKGWSSLRYERIPTAQWLLQWHLSPTHLSLQTQRATLLLLSLEPKPNGFCSRTTPSALLIFKPQNLHRIWMDHLPPSPLYQVTLWPEGSPVTVIVRANSLDQRNQSLRPFLSVLLLCWLQTVLLFWRTLTSTRFFHVALLKISSFSYIKFYCWIYPILGFFLPIFINNSIAITIAHLAAVLCKGLPGWYIL